MCWVLASLGLSLLLLHNYGHTGKMTLPSHAHSFLSLIFSKAAAAGSTVTVEG